MTSTSSAVVLTGFMGTGKTTVGRALADLLGYDFVDTDQLIEADHGPIPLIFAEQGEEAFRSIEREVADRLAGRTATVIATGGRFMIDPANADALRAARTFCLTASVDLILKRVLGDGTMHRPLLDSDDPAARIRSLLEERAEAYGRFEQIPTENRSPAEIAEDIVGRL